MQIIRKLFMKGVPKLSSSLESYGLFTFVFSLKVVCNCFDVNSLAANVAATTQVKMTCMAFNRQGLLALHFIKYVPF